MDRLIIVMPAYNEEENIEHTLDEWYEVVEKVGNDSLLAVFNDGSKDRTFEIMKRWGGGIASPVQAHYENELRSRCDSFGSISLCARRWC